MRIIQGEKEERLIIELYRIIRLVYQLLYSFYILGKTLPWLLQAGG